jgi:hypothetical protein
MKKFCFFFLLLCIGNSLLAQADRHQIEITPFVPLGKLIQAQEINGYVE